MNYIINIQMKDCADGENFPTCVFIPINIKKVFF